MPSLRTRTRFLSWCFCIAVASVSTVATAVPISIFNTGVDAIGNAIVGNGVADTHYSLIVQPGAATAVTVDPSNYPFPFWIANNAGSRWIGPAADSNGPSGNYVYQTTFNVPSNAILSSVSVSGDWATDDPGTDIRINGASTGQLSPSYGALTPFSVTSGFVLGTNTLDFYITNAAFGTNPTGLRVDHIVGTYQVVPEPSAALLIGAASLISTLTLRRRRSL